MVKTHGKTLIPILAIACFFHLYKLGYFELQGDEASGVLNAVKTAMGVYEPKLFANIFLFGHAPFRVILNFFSILTGNYSEFMLRFPNAVFGILSCIPLYFIIYRSTKNKTLALLGGLVFVTGGMSLAHRLAMGVGAFVFFHTSAFYFFLNYVHEKKQKDFNFYVMFNTFAALSYMEGIMFVLPSIVILLINKLNLLAVAKNNWKTITLWSGILFSFIGVWLYVPILLFNKGLKSNYQDLGGWRIINRVSQFESMNNSNNFHMLGSYIGSFSTTIVLLFVCIFIFRTIQKRNQDDIALLLWGGFPIFYFTFLVANPVNHITFYYSYLCLMLVFSFRNAHKKIKAVAVAIVFAVSIGSAIKYFEVVSLKSPIRWGPQPLLGIHQTALKVRENLNPEMSFFSDIEGYISRFYFGGHLANRIQDADMVIITDETKPHVISDDLIYAYKIQCHHTNAHIFVRNFKDDVIEMNECNSGRSKFFDKYNRVKKVLPAFFEKYSK